VLVRLGVDGVKHVVSIDVHAADTAELVPGIQVGAFLIEDLDAAVTTVGYKQAAFGIHCQCVRRAHLTVFITPGAPALHKGSVRSKLGDTAHCSRTCFVHELAVVALGYKNVSVRSYQDGVRLIQFAGRVTCFTWFAEDQQHFALWAELDDLVATIKCIRVCSQFLRSRGARIGYPNVAFLIHVQTVRPGDQAGTKALYNVALRIEFDDRVHVGTYAGVRAATVSCPQMKAVHIDMYTGDGTPAAAFRQCAPVTYGFVRVGQMVHRRNIGVFSRTGGATLGQGGAGCQRHQCAGKQQTENGFFHDQDLFLNGVYGLTIQSPSSQRWLAIRLQQKMD